MRAIKTHELTQLNMPLSATEQHWLYNGLDAALTHEIFHVIEPQLDKVTRATYEFEKSLQGPVLEMRLRGVLVDQERRSEVIREYEAQLGQLSSQLSRILSDGLGLTAFNWRSPKQLLDLFYTVLGLPPIKKRNSKGIYAPTVDRDALERLDVHFHAQPIISHILALRDIGKKIGVLKTEIDLDGRMRTSYNIAGTTTGRFSSSLGDFGTGCVLPGTEVLTRAGWRKIEHIIDFIEIAQYDRGQIVFMPCKIHKEFCKEGLIQFKTEQTQLTLTKGHRVLFHDDYNGFRTEPAAKVSTRGQVNIPLGGQHNGELKYPAFVAMLMADFSKTQWGWAGNFTKQRKIERFLRIAEEFELDYTEHKCKRPGYRRFFVKGQLQYPKEWGSWVLELDQESASDLVEEARYWDSHDRGSGFIFFSSSQEQAEWFATLTHLVGKSSVIYRKEQGLGSYSTTTMWWVNVKARCHAAVQRKHWKTIEYSGPVYCPQVPSSYWLVRENGFISVTGNTNLQNIEQRLRSVFIADEGMKFAYIDLEQAESRLVGAIEWNLFHDGRYLDACESGDLHTYVCRLAWKDQLAWTGDLKLDKALAESPFYRQHSYRHMAKVLGHGTNYNGKPFTMAKHTKLDQKLIAAFQDAYFAAFPAHRQWHARVAQELYLNGNLTSLSGRRRWFFGRRNDDATIREAIAFDPQGSVGDILNRGMLAVWRSGKVQLLLQIHDAILVQYPEQSEPEIIPLLLETIKHPIQLKHDRTLVIPSEAKIGWNWGEYNERENPDGLIKYSASKPDPRRRTRPAKAAGLLDRFVR